MKQSNHFPALDGLRGFAALSVLFYHLGHWLGQPGVAVNSGLAVDLFFCLSGYVLPCAYGRRFSTTSSLQFMWLRVVRLFPLMILATLISAAYVIVRNHSGVRASSAGTTAVAALLGLLNLPYLTAPRSVGGPEVFPLNGPQYTLFLEFVVNAVWWRCRRLNQIPLAVTSAACSALLLIALGFGGDTPGTLFSGFARVGTSFSLGVMAFYLRSQIPRIFTNAIAFWGLATLMATLFLFPVQAPFWMQMLWVFPVSPLLVASGAQTRFNSRIASTFTFAGALSYPIYCLHFPIFSWVNGIYRARFGPQDFAVEAPLVLMVVCLASLFTLKIYDEPLRSRLTAFSQKAAT